MQKAFTDRNANALRSLGIEPTEQNLSLAHAVGPGGAQKLIQAQQSGQGNMIAADVLGLTGAGRTTNPQLIKPVSQVISSNQNRFAGGGTTMAALVPPTPSTSGTNLASSSNEVSSARMQVASAPPIIVNSPTTNNMQQGGSQRAAQYTAPSVVDSEFMKMLVYRII